MGWILLLFLLALGGYGLFRLFEPFSSSQPFWPGPDDERDGDAPHPDPFDPFPWDGDDDV